MVEVIRYSKACIEDLALGYGTRNVRLANGAIHTLSEIHISGLLLLARRTVPSVNGAAVLTASSLIPAGARIWGCTAKITTAFGTSGGLTGLVIGDSTIPDRWSSAAVALTLNTETSQADFSSGDLPVYPTAADVLVSGVGGLFDATGAIELAVHYSLLRHPS